MSAEYILFDFPDDATLLDKDHMVRLLVAIVENTGFQFLKKGIVSDDPPRLTPVPR